MKKLCAFLALSVVFCNFSCGRVNGGFNVAGIFLSKTVGEHSDIEYPIVTDLADTAIADSINTAIRGLISEFIDTKQASYDSIDVVDKKPMEFWVKHNVTANSNGILSIVFTLSSYAGGAHPMTEMKSLTYDLDEGRCLSLADIFDPAGDYIAPLSSIVKDSFAAQQLKLLQPFERIRPDQDYFISADGLVIYFQLYEYTPYVNGFPRAAVSLEQAVEAGVSHIGIKNLLASISSITPYR